MCGSSTQTATTTVVDGARLILKTAFVARAEATCLGPDEELGSLREPTDLRSRARFVDTLVPVVEKVVEGRRALPVPPGDEQTVKEMVDAQ